MEKKYYRFLKMGNLVSLNGEVYKLQGNLSDAEGGLVPAVKAGEYERYNLLCTWSWNGVGITEEQRDEMESLVHQIPCEECEPADVVRFIDSSYNTKFKVRSGDDVNVNGKRYKAFYRDSYHFVFADEDGHDPFRSYGGCFHICQFAEICEKNGVEVAPAGEKKEAV